MCFDAIDMRAFDELRKLEMFFKEETRRGCSIIDLYELVQHAGNILPRLSVYIKSKEAPAKDVLKDLVEMCRGIQHPVRGLFLRSYLSQVSRDKLPDIGSEYEGDADTVMDAVEFVLQNFTEMNKLWVRMQHQGPAREKEKREKGRSELRDLVGKNLHVLSQIEGVDLDMYKDTVLPRVLEQVVNCKDELAQFYLMDCIIQSFQMSITCKLLKCCWVPVLSFRHLMACHRAQVDMPIFGAVTLYSSLLTFTLHVHPDRLDYADQVLGACVKKLSSKGKLEDSRATKQIVALLSAPLEKYNDVVTALKLSNYHHVMEYLDNETNKIMATVIIQSIMKNNTRISTADKVEALFELITGLIKDLDGNHEEVDEDDFKEEQNSVARLIQMLHNDDPVEMYKIICTVRRQFMTGGPKRLPFTIPPLVFSSLKLVRRLQGQDEGQDENPFGDESLTTPKKIFQLLNQTIEVLSTVPAPELALQLYLQCAEAANDSDLEPVAYEFLPKHIFYMKKKSQVLICLKRALRIANAAQQMSNATRGSTGSVTLFVEILSKYLYFFEKGNPQVTAAAIQSLIELINTEMQSDSSTPDPAADAFFASTLRYIQFQKQKGGAIGERAYVLMFLGKRNVENLSAYWFTTKSFTTNY
ncbi:hypothetical protein GH714_016296 [Hevea brasiliensis]|uniref:Vacuolar protein sorting-associated protein 35 n=1 Tax=Hevea brasiliensis TaxID=3981 RepID=A0A6A6M1A0_HEVBR|nr:hypothetical protein GH714_016296 [Hevea brasiliensis]